MIKIGLTGSIATGKTTISKILKSYEIKVFNDDDVVRRLFKKTKVVRRLKKNFADCITNNIVDIQKIRDVVFTDLNHLDTLEQILHPLVRRKRRLFIIIQYLKNPFSWIVFDSPLLFEKKINKICDYTILVKCSESLQLKRVLARGNISKKILNKILSRQMPQSKKEQKADFIIDTEVDIVQNLQNIKNIIITIKKHDQKNSIRY